MARYEFTVLFALITAFNAVVLVTLLFFFPLAFMNLVFTTTNLPSSSVPFYDATLASTRSDVYGVEWWFTAIDVLRIIPPTLLCFCMTYTFVKRDGSMGLVYTIVMVVCLLIELGNMLRRGWSWYYCGDWQVCRNTDPLGDPSEANTTFVLIASYNIIFVIFDTIYLIISHAINRPEKLWVMIEGYDDYETPLNSIYIGKEV